jgi:DNA-directed RNA polymerase subunit RPC12/RpoP
MSLKCSLLGHRFDESAVEHDRQEDGSEVVIVTTELEACSRCGETRVVSENKEVRTTEAPEDAAESANLPFDGSPDDPDEAVDTAAETGTELIGDAETGGTAGDAGDEDATATAGADDTVTADDAPTGGEILGDDGASADDGSTADDGVTATDEATADEEVTADDAADEVGAADEAATAVEGSADEGATESVDDSPAGVDAAADDGDADDSTDSEDDDAEILGSDDAGSTDPEADAQAQARGDPTSIPDADSGADAAAVGGDSGAGAGVDSDDEDVTDDAVIIDGDSATERDSGEWPEETPSGATADSAEEATEESDVEHIEDDSVVWSGEDDDATDESQSGSADADWPEEESATAEDGPLGEWPEETMPDEMDDAESGPTLEQAASPTITVPEGMYKCSECGFTADVESSPHRAGDFCPECHRGTLVQDEDGGD